MKINFYYYLLNYIVGFSLLIQKFFLRRIFEVLDTYAGYTLIEKTTLVAKNVDFY